MRKHVSDGEVAMRPKSVLNGVVALVVLATGFGGAAAQAQALPTGSARDHGSVPAAAARSTPSADSPKTPRKPPVLPVTPLPPAQRLTAKQRAARDAPIER